MASSPAASTTSHDAPKSKQLEQITFRFCSECSNMLYPKEDEDNHKLQFTCRTCQYTEEATSTCVFRNQLNGDAGETAGVTQDVGSDPTVGNPDPYPHCHWKIPAGWADAADFAHSPGSEVITCVKCHRSLVKIPESYYIREGLIDQSSEEALIKTLMYSGYLLPMEELLGYAGERPNLRRGLDACWV
jgi:DNA-directed RNA polymerase subunit M/transcription elongation factor TFIIS